MEQGIVFLREADVSDLPYDDRCFDLTIASRSHSSWPDLDAGLGEIMHVLQLRGPVALSGGEYFGSWNDTRYRKLAKNGCIS
jgi:ubiquinone/menaquinone biosynthesis C-methylase UbiE